MGPVVSISFTCRIAVYTLPSKRIQVVLPIVIAPEKSRIVTALLSWVRSPDVGDASSANSINRQAIIVWVSELKAHCGFDASRPWEIKPVIDLALKWEKTLGFPDSLALSAFAVASIFI